MPKPHTAVFGYATPNLGDDTQSLAAALHAGSPDCYVDRDRLDEVHLGERHRLVMNSWFAIKRYEAAPQDCIDPIFFGFCIGRPELLNGIWLGYLERHQPIGCRDLTSVEWLARHGIAAYMTGCLTLWMGRRIAPVPPKQRSGIFLVDVPREAEPAIPRELLASAIRLTNEPGEQLRRAAKKDRLRANAALLDQLRSAELVITKRLHVMLPCISFGTPVVTFVTAKSTAGPKNWRFEGYSRFSRLVPISSRHSLPEVDWNDRRTSEIPPDLQASFERFCIRVGPHEAPVYESFADAVERLFPENCPSYPEAKAASSSSSSSRWPAAYGLSRRLLFPTARAD